jgi:hypothetical protein
MIFDSLEQLDAYRESERKVAEWICSTDQIHADEEASDEEASARSCCFSIGRLVPCKRWRKSAADVPQIGSGNPSQPLVSEGGQGTDCSQGEIASLPRPGIVQHR